MIIHLKKILSHCLKDWHRQTPPWQLFHFDNYPALLHKGETVLPAKAAEKYRNGEGGSNFTVEKFIVEINNPIKDGQQLAKELFPHIKRMELRLKESVIY